MGKNIDKIISKTRVANRARDFSIMPNNRPQMRSKLLQEEQLKK